MIQHQIMKLNSKISFVKHAQKALEKFQNFKDVLEEEEEEEEFSFGPYSYGTIQLTFYSKCINRRP